MNHVHPVVAQVLAPWVTLTRRDPADVKPPTATSAAMANQHYDKVLGFALQSVWDRQDLGQSLEAALERASDVYGVEREDLAAKFESTTRKARQA